MARLHQFAEQRILDESPDAGPLKEFTLFPLLPAG
jgi:hypothetical protein